MNTNPPLKIGIQQADPKQEFILSSSEQPPLPHKVLIIGKAGQGKVDLLQSLALQEVNTGKGLIIIDPVGESSEWLVERLPQERMEDLIHFNPDMDNCPTFNPIEIFLGEDKKDYEQKLVISSLLNTIRNLYDTGSQPLLTPKVEFLFRQILPLFLDQSNVSLLGIFQTLADSQRLTSVVEQIENKKLKTSLEETSIIQTIRHNEEMQVILAKYQRLLESSTIRKVVGQSSHSFSMSEVITKNKILIANIAKGNIGEENSDFLGMMLLASLRRATELQLQIPEQERKLTNLVCDELSHYLVEDDFTNMIVESRPRKLSIIVSLQGLFQIESEQMKDNLLGNISSSICFAQNTMDAQELSKQYSIPVEDLTRQPKHQAIVIRSGLAEDDYSTVVNTKV